MDVSGLLNEGREIQTGIIDFWRVFCQLEVSLVIVVCAKTARRCDVTVSVDG